MELGREKGGGPPGEMAYYGQSPASLSSQTSWHSDVDHGQFYNIVIHSLTSYLIEFLNSYWFTMRTL